MTLREDVLKLSGIDCEQNNEQNLDEDIGLVAGAISVGAIALTAIINAIDTAVMKSKFRKAEKKDIDRMAWSASHTDKITYAFIGFTNSSDSEFHTGVVFGLDFVNKYLSKDDDILMSNDDFDKFLEETKKMSDKSFKELADKMNAIDISKIKEKLKAAKKCDTLVDVFKMMHAKHVVSIHFMAYDRLTKGQKAKLKSAIKKSAEALGLPVKIRLAEVSKLKMDKETKSYNYGLQGTPDKIKDENGNEYTRIY